MIEPAPKLLDRLARGMRGYRIVTTGPHRVVVRFRDGLPDDDVFHATFRSSAEAMWAIGEFEKARINPGQATEILMDAIYGQRHWRDGPFWREKLR